LAFYGVFIESLLTAVRRPTPGVGYLEALTQKDVTVVFDGIKRVLPQGIELETGEIIELDAIVCATGFNVSWKPRFPIIGRDGIDLRDQWKDRPTAYLSIAVPNFPNYICRYQDEPTVSCANANNAAQCTWVRTDLFRTDLRFRVSSTSPLM
jgi:cation diffusion facilitator CzcD-associated flavoprotein CzcO